MCAEWTKCIRDIVCNCLRISKLTYVFWSDRLNLVLMSDTATPAAATLAAATLATSWSLQQRMQICPRWPLR